jgi:hypothetical protein
MLCQRQLGTLPSFSPFHLTPFLGGLVSRLAPRPTLWSVCYGRFIVFLVLLSLNLSTFVVRSFSCLSRPPLRVPHRECSVGCLSLACV